MSIFCAAGRDSPPTPPHLQGFYQTVGLGEGVEQSIHGGGNKQDENRWKMFGKMRYTGGKIQEDNSTGPCFVPRDLGSMKKP